MPKVSRETASEAVTLGGLEVPSSTSRALHLPPSLALALACCAVALAVAPGQAVAALGFERRD